MKYMSVTSSSSSNINLSSSYTSNFAGLRPKQTLNKKFSSYIESDELRGMKNVLNLKMISSNK